MPWTVVACAVAGMLASSPVLVRHPGWMRLSCKNCGATLRAGMTQCEYCRTDDIWLVPPWDEHVYPSSSPVREPTPAPSPYSTSSEHERRRQSSYSSPSPAPLPWVDPVFVASSYSAPPPAPSYEPPAPSPCPAPSFDSGGGDFSGGGASGEF